MKSRLIICFAALLCLTATACEDDSPEIRTVAVASERIYANDAVSGIPVLCYLAKYGDYTENWVLWSRDIRGFEYTPGYEYVIEVEVTPVPDPPMDAPSEKYTLHRIVSKTEKTSAGLPPDSVFE